MESLTPYYHRSLLYSGFFCIFGHELLVYSSYKVSVFYWLLSDFVVILAQGKEYVFVANSDNLGAVVDLSILTMVLLTL